jgi:hypothetical protein
MKVKQGTPALIAVGLGAVYGAPASGSEYRGRTCAASMASLGSDWCRPLGGFIACGWGGVMILPHPRGLLWCGWFNAGPSEQVSSQADSIRTGALARFRGLDRLTQAARPHPERAGRFMPPRPGHYYV